MDAAVENLIEHLFLDFHATFCLPVAVRLEPSTPGWWDKCPTIVLLQPGNTKGEVSLYCWPPVWLVWNQLYDNWQFLFLFAKQTKGASLTVKLTSCLTGLD